MLEFCQGDLEFPSGPVLIQFYRMPKLEMAHFWPWNPLRFLFQNPQASREHRHMQTANLDLRMLPGGGRARFRKLLLGKGHKKDLQSGLAGNHVLVIQESRQMH